MNDYLTAGQLAKQAGINKETLRYYEREGLIPEPPRLDNGYRNYPFDSVRKIVFIKNSQQLGFTLKEIRELMLLSAAKGESCLHIHEEAGNKIKIIETKIDELQRMKAALQELSMLCSRGESVEDCHFLHSLWGIEGDCNE